MAEVEELQRNFEAEMERVPAYASQKLDDAVAAIDVEIAKARTQIQTYNESSMKLKQEEENIGTNMLENVETVIEFFCGSSFLLAYSGR